MKRVAEADNSLLSPREVSAETSGMFWTVQNLVRNFKITSPVLLIYNVLRHEYALNLHCTGFPPNQTTPKLGRSLDLP